MKAYKNSNMMFISDTHTPFMHKDAISFYSAVMDLVQPERVFHIGDLLDQYMFGRYDKEPEAMNGVSEVAKAKKQVQQLITLFPELTIVSSNHDDRLFIRAIKSGVPRFAMKSYPEIIGAQDANWRWVDDLTIRLANRTHLYMAHSRGGTMAVAQKLGMNVVQGHHHNKQGVQRFHNSLHNLFTIDTGCMIDDTRYAFAYNKSSIIRPMLGCGALIDCKPYIFTMNLTKSGRWDGRLN